MNTQILKTNQMTILSEKNNAVHSITMALYFRGGTAYEDLKYRGITHLMEHMMFRSLNGMKQKDLYDNLRQMGTMLYATTYMDCVKFDISFSPKYFREIFHIVHLILEIQTWTMEEIALEKKVVLKQIEEKGEMSTDEYIQNYSYRINPWNQRIMGNKTTVNRISRKKLLEWKEVVCNPANACFILTGNYTDEEFSYAIEQLQGHPKTGEPFKRFLEIPPALFHRSEKDNILYCCDSDDSNVSLSFDIHKENREISNLISCIIADLGSVLSLELRELRAWVTDFDIYVDHNNSFARLFIEFSISNTYLMECLEFLLHVISNMNQYLSAKDLNAAKEYWKYSAEILADSPYDLCEELAWKSFVTGPDIHYPYQQVTLDQFKKVAFEIFKPENAFISIGYDPQLIRTNKLKNLLCEFRLGKFTKL